MPSRNVYTVTPAVPGLQFRIAGVLSNDAPLRLKWDLRAPLITQYTFPDLLDDRAIVPGLSSLEIQCVYFALSQWTITAKRECSLPLRVIDVLENIAKSLQTEVNTTEKDEIRITHGSDGVVWVRQAKQAQIDRIAWQNLSDNEPLRRIDFLAASGYYNWAGLWSTEKGPQHWEMRVGLE